MAKHKQADKNYIAVMGKIFTVLECFTNTGATQEPVPFAEISKLPFSQTTKHRILYSLEKLGYVEKAEARSHYRLGAKFFEFVRPAVQVHLLRVAKSEMQEMMIRHGETINLGMLDGGQITYAHCVQTPSALCVQATPGDRRPLHSTALGKAILAFLPPSEINALLDENRLVRRTPKTITRKAHLLEHLGSVREQGVALDMEENLSGVTCVAAPIFDPAGRVFAALSMSGPTTRMTAKLAAVSDEVRAAASIITKMVSPQSKPESPSPAKSRRKTATARGWREP